MTKNDFLDVMKDFTEAEISGLMLPVRVQVAGEEPVSRPAEVYKMRLPDSKAAKKKAPYILHQIITSKDIQEEGKPVVSTVALRSIFCVYCDDEQEGGLFLLTLMERLRIALLRQVVLAKRYQLNLKDGIETLIYPDDSAPYYLGEMMTNWRVPSVEREVNQWL